MKTREKTALMGQIVTVNKFLSRTTRGNRRNWVTIEGHRRAGWVVGFRTVQCGILSYEGYEGEGASLQGSYYLDPTAYIPCMLVAYWHNQKPIHVPLDGYELGGKPHPTDSWGRQDSCLRKRAVEEAQMTMLYWPRDSRGRWIKWIDIPAEVQAKITSSWREM